MLNRLLKESIQGAFRVELAFKPASKPFILASESAADDTSFAQ
jgi:hypothetical protein